MPAIMNAQSENEKTIWNFSSLEYIGDCDAEIFGAPVLDVEKKEISFNGIDDGVIVDGDPLDGAKSFTIEIIFYPSSSSQKNHEQRFLHIQNPGMPNRRALIELRLFENQTWALDGFVSGDNSKCTLFDASLIHLTDKWFHAALVYENGKMKNYVNGKLELEGAVQYLPIERGKVSLGMRMNHVSFFKGKIKQILFSKEGLKPEQFSIPDFVK